MSAAVLYGAILAWGILCGAVVYEHVAIIPVWSAHPPESLSMWSGRYRVAAQRFWPVIHPIILILLAASIALNWSNDARNLVGIIAAIYLVGVLVPTIIWFVPNLLRLVDVNSAYEPTMWRNRSKLWERLSLARGIVVLALIVPLILAVDVRN